MTLNRVEVVKLSQWAFERLYEYLAEDVYDGQTAMDLECGIRFEIS